MRKKKLEKQGTQVVAEEHMYEFPKLKAILNKTDLIFAKNYQSLKKNGILCLELYHYL